MPHPPLTDGVVALRPPSDKDLDAIDRGIHDPDVVQAFGHSILSPMEVLELNRARWSEGTGATFAICDGRDNALGHVWVNLADKRRGSVGYWLLPEARGQGLASRAVRLVSAWALRQLGLVRLGLFAEPANGASLRVAERCGFQREGILRSYDEIDGRPVDYVVLSLLTADLDRDESSDR